MFFFTLFSLVITIKYDIKNAQNTVFGCEVSKIIYSFALNEYEII